VYLQNKHKTNTGNYTLCGKFLHEDKVLPPGLFLVKKSSKEQKIFYANMV
jgi:hypothetical protein